MARTRKKTVAATAESPSEDASFNPAEFDSTPTTQNATHLPADIERQASHENGHAAAVGRREPVIRSGLTFTRNDLLSGIKQGEGFRLVGEKKIREGVIAFEEKPSPEVISTMKDAAFDWRAADKLWTHPVRPESGWQDRAHVEATFDAVSKQVRMERNIGHTVGVTA
jgi:hypothetical protein